jgi:siroheme synthase-like protein
VSYRYPILLDVSECLAVIVGGGQVAVRKAGGLIDAGARGVRVVSPAFHADMPAGVERVVATYDAGHLAGARLAFAATDSAVVNDAVVRDARAAGIWVNRADVDEEGAAGDFTVPAQLREGSVLVTVSAGGSPLVAAGIRDDVRGKLDRRWARLADAMQVLRPRIRAARGLDAGRRRSLFKELASAEALTIAGSGDDQSLWRWAVARYPELEQA